MDDALGVEPSRSGSKPKVWSRQRVSGPGGWICTSFRPLPKRECTCMHLTRISGDGAGSRIRTGEVAARLLSERITVVVAGDSGLEPETSGFRARRTSACACPQQEWCARQVSRLLFPSYQDGTSTFRFHAREWLARRESHPVVSGNSGTCFCNISGQQDGAPNGGRTRVSSLRGWRAFHCYHGCMK